MKANWRTTIGGVLSALGISMQASDNATVKLIGTITAAIGTFLLGAAAKDSTSATK